MLLMKLLNLKNKRLVFFILLATVLVGSFLRFYNLNWDEGHFFHPDERNIAAAVAKIKFFSQLNPHFFAYGSLPIYFYRLVGESLAYLDNNKKWLSDWGLINLIGRYFSALVSTISIILIYRLASKLFNTGIGLFSSFLFAFSPILIQLAHFAITESLLIFWLLLITIFSLNIYSNPKKIRNYLLLGLIVGLALSTKLSAISFVLIPLSIFFFCQPKKSLTKFMLAVIVAAAIFCLTSPYVFLDRGKFIESMNYENGVVLGRLKVPYTLQFNNTPAYLYQLVNLPWLIGLPAIVALVAIPFFILSRGKIKIGKRLLLTVFPIVYFAYVGSWHTKFIRYTSPLIPFLLILASWFLWQMAKSKKVVGMCLVLLIAISNFLWSLGFFHIYLRPSTRITASKWVYENIPAQSKILQEHWDDGLPIRLAENLPSKYNIEQLTIYEPDSDQKLNYYSDKLAKGDYLVISSRRLSGTLPYLPDKYPLTSRYYQLLFGGKLGYQPLIDFSSYPQIFGIIINDDLSEETFQVYDHPKILIFKNVERLTEESLYSRLKNND